MLLGERRAALRDLVARTDLGEFADRVLDSFWTRPESLGTRPPRREGHAFTRWNLDLIISWVLDGRSPTEDDLDLLRRRARTHAEQGVPVDFVPGNFRRGARFGWNAALELARAEEREALLESADLLFEFVDRVSRIYAEAYEEAARAAPVPAPERSARALLARLSTDGPPSAEHVEYAERLGFEITGALRPFVIALPGPAGVPHVELAARLRRTGLLAASEGRWVAGLANAPLQPAALRLPAQATIGQGGLTTREEIRTVLDELRMLVAVARSHGRSGEVHVCDHLPELLLRSAPRIAAQIRGHVYGPLRPFPELGRTLDAMVENDFNGIRAAAALPVHRNTLRERCRRIAQLTGIELERTEDRGLVWLAYLYAPPREGRA
jgi:hypothetical protein